MFERVDLILKCLCVGLATLIIFQLSGAVARSNPLEQLRLPSLRSVSTGSEKSIDKQLEAKSANSTSHVEIAKPGTTSIPASAPSDSNSVARSMASNPMPGAASMESQGQGVLVDPAIRLATSAAMGRRGGPALPSRSFGPPGMMMGSGPPLPNLPPAIQARVDRIVQSEILGQIIRPMPMGLLGVAGKDALIRTPTGQTGWLREGGELGGVKLLRIGTNRVLIDHEGQNKELTIFSGFGSETLLPKGKEKTQ